MPRWNAKDIKLIEEFLANGKSVSFIAAHFSTTTQNVRMVMSRHGLKVRKSEAGAPSTLDQKRLGRQPDLATRIRMLRGEELLANRQEFSFSDDQLRKWLEPNGFVAFAKEVLSVDLQDYQLEMIRKILNHKRVCVVAGRGVGKSFTVAVACLYIAVTMSNQKVLIISPAQRQSDLLYDKILAFIGRSNELFNSVESSNKEKCQFTNNSILCPLPSTTFIRGFQNVDFIFCDESAYFLDPEQVWAAIEPMLAIRNEKGEYGALVVVGSPSGKTGKLWECFNRPDFTTMHLPSTVNKYISEDWVEKQKSLMPSVFFECEIMAQFSESIDCFFPASIIAKCSYDYDFSSFPEQGKAYYLGVDVGRVRDSSVLTVISEDGDDFLRVESAKELSNVPFASQIATIKLLHETYRFRRICVEKAGLSLQLVEELQKARLPIEEFVPTVDNKFEAYSYLLRQMEDAKLTIPVRHQKLQFELRSFKYEVTEQGKVKLHHESELAGDDFVDSLCFAVWATNATISGRNYGFYLA